MKKPPVESKIPATWQPRFGIRGILLLMLVVSVMATGGYYFVLSIRGGRAFQFTFILFTLAAPLLIMVVVSVVRWILEGNRRSR